MGNNRASITRGALLGLAGENAANTGFNSRGLAYWSDGQDARIFLPAGNAYLWALKARSARTKRPIADLGADDTIDATQRLGRPAPRRDYQLMSVPIVVGDVVLIGSVVFDGPRFQLDAPRGDVRGFDVRTGDELWEFHTIPQPGEFGNETWENDSWEYSGSTPREPSLRVSTKPSSSSAIQRPTSRSQAASTSESSWGPSDSISSPANVARSRSGNSLASRKTCPRPLCMTRKPYVRIRLYPDYFAFAASASCTREPAMMPCIP